MKRTMTLLACAVALLCATAPWTSAASTQPWEKYELLVKRNIFSRTRGQPTPEAGQTVAEAPPPERFVYLRGVMRSGGVLVAFLEDARSGSVTPVHAGDDAVRGKVSSITLAGIIYARDGRDAAVGIGENLEKTSLEAPSGVTAASGQAPAEAAGGAGGSADTLERLRRRRQQELGR